MSTAPPESLVAASEARPRIPPRESASRLWRNRLRPAMLILLGWTAVGVFLALPDTFNVFVWYVTLAKVVESWAWALLTPALLVLDRKLVSSEQKPVRIALIFLLLSVPFSLAHVVLTGVLLYPISPVWWNPLLRYDFAVYYFLGSWQTYSAVVGILYAIKYYNRFLTSQLELARVEKHLIESRLNALRLQLEPHFLFNALNTISSEVVADPNLARNMIGDLGALLRQSLECQGRAEITLAQELSLLDHYLSIQRVRFGDRIEIVIEADPEALSVMVPSMLLQPLVENAIRHGIERRMSGGTVVVSALRVGDRLEILVLDDGVGLPPSWRMDGSTGLGIRVARERLAALYPDMGEQGFAIRGRDGGGTEVAIRVPLHRSSSEAA